MDMIPDWLRKLIEPIQSAGVPTINRYAGKRLDELDADPQARMEALGAIAEPDDEEERERKRQIMERLNRRDQVRDEVR